MSNGGFIEAEFFHPKSLGEREWGTEELLAYSSGKWMMKKLFIKKGSQGGLQKHILKDEGAYIVSGEMLIRYTNKDGELLEKVLKAGSTFRFPPGCVHQEEAISDVILIEASTPHLNDRVRMEKEFGLTYTSGLPSTKPDDIVIL